MIDKTKSGLNIITPGVVITRVAESILHFRICVWYLSTVFPYFLSPKGNLQKRQTLSQTETKNLKLEIEGIITDKLTPTAPMQMASVKVEVLLKSPE